MLGGGESRTVLNALYSCVQNVNFAVFHLCPGEIKIIIITNNSPLWGKESLMMFELAELLPLTGQMKKLYVKACRAVCKKYELTQTEFDILDFLGERTGIDTANEIARRRLIKKANISTSVDRLIKKGYIRRRVDPDDRRFIHLELTGNAEPTVSEIKKTQSDFFSRFTTGLSKEELETYKRLTEKLLYSIKRCARRADGGSIC